MSDPDLADLVAGPLDVVGRVMPASNATFLAEVTVEGTAHQVVYKPVAGEKPLWDFPDGTLADRELAAYALSEATGWDLVPPTFLREGPHGPGMVQLWREPAEDASAVDVVPRDAVPAGWRRVVSGYDEDDQPVALVHEDTPALRRMAVFDVVANNADRKGGHVLAMPDGHRHAVDHGLTFHVEDKLRTVLWGWQGEELTDEERTVLRDLRTQLAGGLGDALGALLTPAEVAMTTARVDGLLAAGCLPGPGDRWPVIPWPPF